MEMETCMRGFSFMPEMKVEVDITNLQYIEGSELEHTWKASRRERQRQQEQKIWEEFVVKEQDVLRTFCKEDPYQFLEQLPEECLKELMEIQLQKMKKEREEEEKNAEIDETSNQQEGDGDSTPQEADSAQHTVTFADDVIDNDDCEMFRIFDDKDEHSGPEDEEINDSLGSPCTVREREGGDLSPTSLVVSADKVSSKSSENVSNMIESSIYCARVKDLRMKINDVILAIITELEQRDIMNIDPEDMVKMFRRSTEFCSRFNRIYLYQLQRQIHDVERNNSVCLPFAKHTQFQSQMVRIVSLHQNMLQAFQVFHKSIEQTGCARECSEAARALIAASRAAAAATAGAAPPTDKLGLTADLYADNLLATCDSFESAVAEYATKLSVYMRSTENTNTSHSKKSTYSKGKKKSHGTWSKSGSKSVTEAEARLSMYSFDTLRINLNSKSSSSKENQSSGTSKARGGVMVAGSAGRGRGAAAGGHTPKGRTKSPRPGRSRRPPRRAPVRRRSPRDADPHTMVEAVDNLTCTSSHASREVTPARTPRTPSRDNTPRPHIRSKASSTLKRTQSTTPRKLPPQSPKFKNRRKSPIKSNQQNIKTALSSIKSDPAEAIDCSQIQLCPVSKIQCAKKADEDTLDSKLGRAVNSSEVGSTVNDKADESPKVTPRMGNRTQEEADMKTPGDRMKSANLSPARCEVSRIVRQLCGGDTTGSKNDRVSGAKNAQLLYVNGSSPRQPSTPQLLRILEETIRKKSPRPMYQKIPTTKDTEQFRLTFNIPEKTADKLFQYRTKFVQHMLTSPMYANSVVGKPWEVIGRVSEHIIDEILRTCMEEMQLAKTVESIYNLETH